MIAPAFVFLISWLRHHPPPARRCAPDDRLQRMIQYSRDASDEAERRGVLDTRFREYDDFVCVAHRAPTAELLPLVRNRLWLRLQRLRIEADIEDVGIAGRSGRHRIQHILSNQSERYAAVF